MLLGIMFFCVTAPFGLGVGMGIMELQTFTTTILSGTLQGIACGTFLYVTFFEVSITFSCYSLVSMKSATYEMVLHPEKSGKKVTVNHFCFWLAFTLFLKGMCNLFFFLIVGSSS